MGKGQDRHRARRAKGYTYMRLDGYRARQSIIGLSVHCANSYIPHVQHIICTYMLRDVGICTVYTQSN